MTSKPTTFQVAVTMDDSGADEADFGHFRITVELVGDSRLRFGVYVTNNVVRKTRGE